MYNTETNSYATGVCQDNTIKPQGVNPSPLLTYLDILRDKLNESVKYSNHITELIYILEKNPEAARILELVQEVA